MWNGPSPLITFAPAIEHLTEAACLESAEPGGGAIVNALWVDVFGVSDLTPMREVPTTQALAPALAAFDHSVGLAERMAARRTGGAASAREALTTPDGRTLVWDYVPIKLRGQVVVHLWRFRDATRRRMLEDSIRQAQRLNTVGRLAGGIAHDFNNLLTAVVGYCDLLDTQFDNGDPRRFDLHEIRNAAMRASSLTRQLLAFSRRQIMQPEVVDVGSMIAELPKMLARLMGEQIRLEVNTPDVPTEVFADPGQIEQAIFSLAANSRDAMPDGGEFRVTVTCSSLDERRAETLDMRSGPVVKIVVEDTGVGMDEATRAGAFEPFMSTKPLGQGLGLPTVYGIVRQTGGAVLLDSAPGQGTKVEIILPCHMPPAVEPVAEPMAPPPVPVRSGPPVVLVVEDEGSVLRLVRRVLEGESMIVLSAQDAEEALLLASQHVGPIDLLLTDVVMPGLNGIELAHRMASDRPGMPVLFMSGYADHALVQRDVVDLGRPFLQKPFAPDRLLARVREVLG